MGLTVTRRIVLAAGAAAIAGPSARAATGDAEREIVDKARVAVDDLRRDKNTAAINGLLPRSKGVMVFPALQKAGFILGAEVGSGVLLGRAADGSWSAPAFCRIESGSIGVLVGYQKSEVIFAIMTDKALEELVQQSQFTLGGAASVAAGPAGVGVAAATTPSQGADIYSYARGNGAYVGASFDGTRVSSSAQRNEAYYGKPANARDIVINRKFTSTYAKALQDALSKPAPAA